MTVELDRFSKDLSEAGHKICSGAFLAIDAWHLFYPAYPPIAVLFQHRCVLCTHWQSVRCPLSSRLLDRSWHAKTPLVRLSEKLPDRELEGGHDVSAGQDVGFGEGNDVGG